MYKYIASQIKRSAVLNIAFCLLLAMTGTLLCLGTGLLLSAHGSSRLIDEQFTTIALPDASAIRRHTMNQIETLNITEFDTGDEIITPEHIYFGSRFRYIVADFMVDDILREIDEVVYGSGAVDMDSRNYLGAYSADVVPFFVQDQNPLMLPPGNAGGSAAFVVRVTYIEEAYGYIHYSVDPVTDEGSYSLIAHAYVSFEVEEVISLHPDTPVPSMVYMSVGVQDARGGYFFELGGRYFIYGQYSPYYWKSFTADDSVSRDPLPFVWFGMDPLIGGDGTWRMGVSEAVFGAISEEVVDVNIVQSRENLHSNVWTSLRRLYDMNFADYDFPLNVIAFRSKMDAENWWFRLGDMSFEEALLSDIGQNIELAVTAVERNANRLNILTTDNIGSMFQFHQRRATLFSGRMFTEEEYEAGARVAIINQPLANKNDLVVGDIITLTFYEGMYASVTRLAGGDASVTLRSWWPGGYSSGMLVSKPIEFEIIGTFNAPRAVFENPNAIPMNTIFIPNNSFEGFAHYYNGSSFWQDDRAESPLLNTIIIPNGRNEEFRETVNTLLPGYGNFFIIYDQGYSIVRAAIDNLIRGAVLIFILCLAGWLIAMLVFCLFFVLRKKKEVGLLYALGISKKNRFRWVLVQCLVIILVAQGIAFVASTVFYERILDYAVETAMQEAATDDLFFTDAAVAADGVAQDPSVYQDPWAVFLGIFIGVILLILSTGGISWKMTKGETLVKVAE